MKKNNLINMSLMLSTTLLTACGGASSTSLPEDEKLGSLPEVIIEPVDNPASPEKVALGKLLFWDPILSGNLDIACASCHHPDNGYAENIDLSLGVGGMGLSELRHNGVLIKRNAPTIINTAYNGIDETGSYNPSNTSMFWDNRAVSLEDQAMAVLLSEEEMRGPNFIEDEIINELTNRLSTIDEYVTLFTAAFGDSTISGERIVQAIASFERSIVSFNSRFDQYARGNESALNQQEIRGLNAFINSGCSGCHSGSMFSDFELHNLSVDDNAKLVVAGIEDNGVNGEFRTPSLRNVSLTAPYMHNGTVSTLREAIEFYDDLPNPLGDPDISDLDFDDNEESVSAIVAFLETLTDDSFDKLVPASVPSGLHPGGDI